MKATPHRQSGQKRVFLVERQIVLKRVQQVQLLLYLSISLQLVQVPLRSLVTTLQRFIRVNVLLRRLTCLVGGDGDSGVLPHLGCQRRHAVLRLDLKGVVGVGEQVAHGHRGVVEARRSGYEAHVAAAGLTPRAASGVPAGSAGAAAFAEDGEGEIPAPARVLRPAPVQDH